MPCCNPGAAYSAYAAESVRNLLSRGGRGEILMVNSAGVYLSAEEHTVFLCDFSWGPVPSGIAVDAFRENVDSLCLQPGEAFTFGADYLRFPGGILRLRLTDFPTAANFIPVPDSQRIRQAAEDIAALQKTRGISMLVLPLILKQDSPEILTLNPYCTRAYPLLCRLLRALVEDTADIRPSVEKLLGLGAGLTPSADDVMLGMLYVFRRLPESTPPSVRTFREIIAALCGTHTNRISAAYLNAILRGEHFARMEQIWRGICGKEPLDSAVLTQIGSSSGSEMLLGMLLALRVCGFEATTGNCRCTLCDET